MLTEQQRAGLKERFVFFDERACAGLFSADQEDAERFLVEGQGRFPAVRMANGTIWFYDRARRPRNAEGAPMKAQAAPGPRTFCAVRADAPELALVEGEGHAIALLSVGWQGGVVVCGGAAAFTGRAGEITEALRRLVDRKRVRIVFDDDAAGTRAASACRRRCLEVGATQVAVLPGGRGWGSHPEDARIKRDLEDWLADFETAAAASASLARLFDGMAFDDPETVGEAEAAEEAVPEQAVRCLRINGGHLSRIYDGGEWRLLALDLPADGADDGLARESIRHDVPEPERTDVQIVDALTMGGVRYVPAVDDWVETGAVPAPTPAADYGTSEGLWDDIIDFLRRYVALPHEGSYSLAAAYVLVTYRTPDVRWAALPILRLHGNTGGGKSQALNTIGALCYWGMAIRPTPANLHRVVEMYCKHGGTLLWDEFNLFEAAGQRGASQSVGEMLDALATSTSSNQLIIRCSGRDLTPQAFEIFCPKITAGYGCDEHPALARRTVSIDMDRVTAEARAKFRAKARGAEADTAFREEALALRRRLMAWRIAKRAGGEPTNAAYLQRFASEIDIRVADTIWPLLAMVPAGRVEALEALYTHSGIRAEAVIAATEYSRESLLLMAMRTQTPIIRDGERLYPVGDLAALLRDESHEVPAVQLGWAARSLGLAKRSARVGGEIRRCIALAAGPGERLDAERRLYREYDLIHPVDEPPDDDGEPAL